MINSDAEIALDYLLSPEFELINSAGKPLTGGYIEVYIHGTRNKYYCYSDWAGTLHPFQIPLDSLGSNIVLASPDNAYDVYVYNKYGSLIMSRYNVHCQGTGGGGGSYAGDKLFYGQYTAHNVAETASLSKAKGNIDIDSDGYLQLKQGMSYHITVRGAFQVNDVTNTETTLNYIEYSTISPIKVDVDFTKADPQNFELSYDIYDLAEDMAYQVAFEQINGMVTDLVVEVHSLSNLATTATFNYEAGDYISIVDNTISVTGINPEDYSTHSETYESIVTAIQLVTGIVPSDAATHDEVYEATVTAINFVTGAIPTPEQELPLVAGDGITITEFEDRVEIAANVTSIEGYATESFVTGYVEQAISGIPEQQQADWEQDDDTAVDYIKNKPDLDIYATHDEVNTVSGEIVETVNNVSSVLHEEMIEIGQAATGLIPDVSDFATHEDVFESAVTSIQLVTGMIPDVSDYATHDEVHESIVSAVEYVTGIIPEAQVQSNWIETDNEDPSYIQNKPNELPLVAGDGITITEDLDHITIAANVTSIDGYATIEEVNSVSSVLHEEIQNIPEQVQADWDETNTSSKAYIQNKPTIPSIEGLATESFVTGYVEEAISEIPEYTAGDYINIDNYEINVTGLQPEGDYATHTDLIEAVSAVTGIGDYGQFYATNISGAATMAKTKGTIDVTNDGKIKLKQGQSYHVTVRGRYNQTTAANDYGDISYIEYITNNSIHVNVDKTITDSQYFEISYDLYKLNSDSNYYIFFSMTGGTVNDLFIEIHAIGSVGGGGGTEYDAGWGIQILNNVISVNPSIIPVVTGFATHDEVFESSVTAIQMVTGLIPDVSDFTTETQVTALIQEAVTSIGPGTTYTAGDYISIENNEISVTGTEDLIMKNLTAGNGITITESGDNIVISANVTSVSGYATDEELQDAVEFVTGLIPDISNLATKEELQDGLELVTGLIPTDYASDEELQDAIELVTGLIPAAQVQSNWTQNDNTQVDYIKNKPAVTNLVAGDGINITESSNDLVISCTVTATPVVSGYVTDEELQDAIELVTGLIPDTSDLATKEELIESVTAVTSIIPAAQIQSDWTQNDNAQVDYIKNKPSSTNLVAGNGITITESSSDLIISCAVTSVSGYVTDEELQDAIELVTGLIPDTSDLATKAELQDGLELVTGLIPTDYASDEELQDAVEFVTGMIPNYTAGDHISIENNEIAVTGTEDITLMNLAAGQNISITLDGSTVEIACTGIPDVTNYATHAEVNNVSGAIVNEIPDVSDFVTESQVTALIPEEEEVDFLSVSGGNCIEITSDVSGNAEIAWHTTAGITDIQMVTALPASPVSSILYIIPEA